ncbi:MAG: M3 family metallopeptidase, partial [Longimicrobiales bacterium]|nr:M3 family metallopeptidase [Longimicrobiales bacterium]
RQHRPPLTPDPPSAFVTDDRNPLLEEGFPPPFHRIRPEHVAPGIRTALRHGGDRLEALAADASEPTWETVVAPLDSLSRWVQERITPATHLMSVAETPELREAYNAVLPEISAFWTRLHLHQGLWRRLKAYADTDEARGLDALRARHLQKTLRAFRRAGAELDAEERERLEALQVELSRLEQRFSENVLDATAAFERLIRDPTRLDGIPEDARARFRRAAEEKGEEGWLLTLDHPSVEAVLKYAHDRELRREIHHAYTTRCREGAHDNRALLVRILALRHEVASLLGYASYPDFVLEERMAREGRRARDFEAGMAERARPHWEADVRALREHAAGLGLERLRPWDVSYVSESLRRARFDFDDEVLRPYFPLDRVQEGLFRIAERVFGIRVREAEAQAVWHPDVRFYELHDEDGTRLGAFFTDWFPRREKRQGAWMHDLVSGGPRPDGGFDPHLGVICGNFTPPADGRTALLNHREVETLFHEFGHLLHHCTSRVPVRPLGGVNVAWDWVELPSQLMENWTWEREALDLFARHHQTGDPIPEPLFQRMQAARRFMGGWAMMRQIGFGTVDLDLHETLAARAAHTSPEEAMAFGRERFLAFSPDPEFADFHILTSFSHLFSGGYAAGYYSYLWAEVLDADAFGRFRREGIFNPETGRAYVDAILSRGDSRDPEELFREFMGRDPDPEALIHRNLGPVEA